MDVKQDINKSQRLFIELGTSLRLESGDSGKMDSCELIGMQVGQYLIVRLPQGSPEIILPALRTVIVVPCTIPCGPIYIKEPAVICPY